MSTTEYLEAVTSFVHNVTENATTVAPRPTPRIGSAAFSTLAFGYQVVLSPIGLITNILNLICLRQSFRNGKLKIYLTALATFDALFSANLIISTYYRTLRWTESYWFAEIYSKTVMPLGATFGGVGNWITILIAADRVIHVVLPLKARTMVTEKMSKIIVCVLIIVFAILRFPYFLIFNAQSATLPSGKEVYWATLNSFFFSTLGRSLFTAQAIIFDYIPCVTLALFNFIIMGFLYRYRQKRKSLTEGKSKDATEAQKETRLTITLWMLIVLAVIGNVPLNFTRIYFLRPFEGIIWKELASFLYILDRTSNFFIYFVSNPEFREAIRYSMPCCPGCTPPKPSRQGSKRMSMIKDKNQGGPGTPSITTAETIKDTQQEIPQV